MEALKILEKHENLNWDYDKDSDILYISIGEPRKALGIDIGEGTIVRSSYPSDHSPPIG